MPGHKRNTKLFTMENPYALDITEIEGFDNLHQAEGILKELSQRIGCLYRSGQSFPLINGSTVGILSGISAAVNKGDTVLIARNSHKSVYHAVTLMELKPIYIYPERVHNLPINGGILPSKVEELLITYPKIKLVAITSPTYEGIVSDIKAIADITHQHGVLLLVDEAHGAHFGFHKKFPQSAVTLGADMIIQSLHKTLPAFTQTAVLHLNRLELKKKVSQYLSIYQSSSPSYLLMAGMDQCIRYLEEEKEHIFQDFSDKITSFYKDLQDLSALKLVQRDIIGQNAVFDLDPSKLTISSVGTYITGHQLNEILRDEYHIIMEMEAKDYVLGMTSICDTQEGFDRLRDALFAIDSKVISQDDMICQSSKACDIRYPRVGEKSVLAITPAEAMQSNKIMSIPLEHSKGKISAAFICLFPPGSPVIVPGEIIEEELIKYLIQAIDLGLTITGLSGGNKDKIDVVIE